MNTTVKTNSQNPDFINLVKLLDAELAKRDGEDHAFYSQFNHIDRLHHVVVLYSNDLPVACGAIKEFESKKTEIKRMYTLPEYRVRGLATTVLIVLEEWAADLGYDFTVLETGKRQPEAIALYKKNGYIIRSNYGQYDGIENSVCFEKRLDKKP